MSFILFHHPDYIAPLPPGSSFPMNKYGLLLNAFQELGVTPNLIAPDPMPTPWIAAVHDPAYVESVLTQTVDRAVARRIGFPVTARVARRSELAVGGTWSAARAALQHGYAANGAGGSHHALPDSGAGFCVFNDLAVAAHRLLEEGDARRVMIVDLDVHQGDGTAVCLAGQPDAFTFSMHAERNFPVRKARSSLDVSLPDGLGDTGYLEALDAHLPAAIAAFGPDLILYQAGVDPHVGDRLGRLSLSDAGLQARDAYVRDLAHAEGVPLASTMGGGYARDEQRMELAHRHARSMLVLAGLPIPSPRPSNSLLASMARPA
jgi:acetoin utilization deacetylase AcuC-like enzyme|tara:strand:+ start:67680 stop:68636 length:957 start_codon:yes stop_codon:yes gene_type:complete